MIWLFHLKELLWRDWSYWYRVSTIILIEACFNYQYAPIYLSNPLF